ncbi:MAG: glutathione S-transferase [Sphingomonadales bacterium RIFCSPHIGHO2_01_FULL_65_20]|uniref:glutathione S-transferase family protein n=1 Tax=unclassified Blastomonas TaxID=2626550 RepID=UPI00082F2A28|nr:glutathione S-transferase family protein [Blastomonas sp.]MCH2239091.1 glutathione S-transferase family protein [Blastomonas sp.]OHC96551.1 MAG: glutathione S-transferase [Sphingomonadales bacterium RIFCSPHIGHO2_01_FULL_65_20]
MKLYQSIGPNPRVVLMFLEEKGAVIDRAFVDIMKGENRQPDFVAKNPFGQVPLLEMDDGTYLSESTAICGYIEEKFPTPALIGSTAEERAVTSMLIRRLDYDVVGPMTTAFRGSEGLPMFQSRMRCLPEAADGLKACARDGLAAFDALLAGKTWLAGDRFTLADILLYCLTEFGKMVGQPLPESLANLAAWSERVAARPSAAASLDAKKGTA